MLPVIPSWKSCARQNVAKGLACLLKLAFPSYFLLLLLWCDALFVLGLVSPASGALCTHVYSHPTLLRILLQRGEQSPAVHHILAPLSTPHSQLCPEMLPSCASGSLWGNREATKKEASQSFSILENSKLCLCIWDKREPLWKWAWGHLYCLVQAGRKQRGWPAFLGWLFFSTTTVSAGSTTWNFNAVACAVICCLQCRSAPLVRSAGCPLLQTLRPWPLLGKLTLLCRGVRQDRVFPTHSGPAAKLCEQHKQNRR